jgi:histidinol-phosphate phosphatase family protein
VFLDKDGTLVENVPYNVDPARQRLVPTAVSALRQWQRQGYVLLVISNQTGIAHGYFTQAELDTLIADLRRQLLAHGIRLAGFYACPHAPDAQDQPLCACRKPGPGLLRQAAAEHGIDLARSWMIGDILHDIEAGRRAGCRTVLVDPDRLEPQPQTPWRRPDYIARDLLDAAGFIERAPRLAEIEA